MTTFAPSPSVSDHAFASNPAPSARRGVGWRWFFITLGTLVALIAAFLIVLVLSFLPGRETRALRNAVITAAPGEWNREFEFGIGRLPAFLARAGVGLANQKLHLPPEALAGLAAFRSGDVTVYHRSQAGSPETLGKALAQVDREMAQRDWEPLVAVQDGTDNVRIFLPRTFNSLRDTQACVLVVDRDELVIVNARVDLEPLLDIIQSKMPEHFLSRP